MKERHLGPAILETAFAELMTDRDATKRERRVYLRIGGELIYDLGCDEAVVVQLTVPDDIDADVEMVSWRDM